MTTDKFSTKKIPHNNGINISLRTAIANTAMIPPIVKLPVSPINTEAGNELYQRNPINAPTNAAINTVISPEFGIYMMFK